jgi:hypothetical protein
LSYFFRRIRSGVRNTPTPLSGGWTTTNYLNHPVG